VTKQILALLERCQGRRIAVIGDLITDQFIYGRAGRVSREAPVLVMEYEGEKLAPGGAANAVHNVKVLGGQPFVIGVIGDDEEGEAIEHFLRTKGIDTSHLVRDPSRPTTTKKRMLASGLHTTFQQLLRMDKGVRAPVGDEVAAKLIAALNEVAGECEALVASDYGYGVFADPVLAHINTVGKSDWCRMLVDSRYQPLRFQGAYLLTPNEPEAAQACQMEINTDADVAAAAACMITGARARAVVVTRGKKGMYLLEQGRPGRYVPIYGTDEISDVTGAGDTVIAAFALAAAAGAELPEAARLATVAAGLVVLKHGTATVAPAEIRAALDLNPWPAS